MDNAQTKEIENVTGKEQHHLNNDDDDDNHENSTTTSDLVTETPSVISPNTASSELNTDEKEKNASTSNTKSSGQSKTQHNNDGGDDEKTNNDVRITSRDNPSANDGAEVPPEIMEKALKAVTGHGFVPTNEKKRGQNIPLSSSYKDKNQEQTYIDKYLQSFKIVKKHSWQYQDRQRNKISLFKQVLGKKTREDERRAAILEYGKFKSPFVNTNTPFMPSHVNLGDGVRHPVTTAQMKGALADISRPLLYLQFVVAYMLYHDRLSPRKYKNFQLLRDNQRSKGKDILVQKVLTEPKDKIAEMYDLLMRVDSEITARTKHVPRENIKDYQQWKRNEHPFLEASPDTTAPAATTSKSKVDRQPDASTDYTNPEHPYFFIPNDTHKVLLAKMAGRDDSRLYLHKPKWLLEGRWRDEELAKKWEEQMKVLEAQKKEAEKEKAKEKIRQEKNTTKIDTYDDDDDGQFVNNKGGSDNDDADDNPDDDVDSNKNDSDVDENTHTGEKKKKKRGKKKKSTKKSSAKKTKKKELTKEERIAEAKEYFKDMETLCGKGMDEFLNWASEASMYMFESGINEYEMDLALIMQLRKTHCSVPIDDLDKMRRQIEESELASNKEVDFMSEAYKKEKAQRDQLKAQFMKLAEENDDSRFQLQDLSVLDDLDNLIIPAEDLEKYGITYYGVDDTPVISVNTSNTSKNTNKDKKNQKETKDESQSPQKEQKEEE